jgi:hypothetical protein
VPLSALVQPGLHVQDPSGPQRPLRQLQVLGASVILRLRQMPAPAMPSSQESQSAGQGWQEGPKKPASQDSQAAPVKPGGQVQVPCGEQTPLPEQAGEHAEDWMSSRESEEAASEGGSWEMSGTLSQKTTRFEELLLLLPEEARATHMSVARRREPAERGVASWVALMEGEVGSGENWESPE